MFDNAIAFDQQLCYNKCTYSKPLAHCFVYAKEVCEYEKCNRKVDYEMGRFIWSIVDKSEYSQEKWAEILNVSTRTMGYYCSGERKPTQRKLLQLIKVAGGINAEDIPF